MSDDSQKVMEMIFALVVTVIVSVPTALVAGYTVSCFYGWFVLTAATRHSITLPVFTTTEFTGVLIMAAVFRYAVSGRDKAAKDPDETIWAEPTALAVRNVVYVFYLGFGWCWYRILY